MTRYPLAWPVGWPRMPASGRTRARFLKKVWAGASSPGDTTRYQRNQELTLTQGVERVLGELRRFNVREGDSIISTNVPVRLDGLPRGDARVPADPGVAVYWKLDLGPNEPHKVMAVDRYDRVQDNLAAVAATLDAMRAIERHGGAQILTRAFTGFTALPAPPGGVLRPWRQVLGLDAPAGRTVRTTEVEDAYRRLRSSTHPDKPGGSPGAFQEVQAAYEQALVELANPA